MYFTMCQTVALGDIGKLDDVQAKLSGVHGAAKNDWSCGAYNNKKVKRHTSESVYTSRGAGALRQYHCRVKLY